MLTGLEDHRCIIDYNLLREIEENYCDIPHLVCAEFNALAESLMDQYSLRTPSNFEEGLELYFVLALYTFWTSTSITTDQMILIIM